MNHYVYEITNLVNGKKYIGKRSCKCAIEDDKYMGSGISINLAIKKYGKEKFKREVLEICSSEEEAFSREKYWICHYDAVKSRKYYNIKDGGFGNTREDVLRYMANMTLEQRKERSRKLSIANKGEKNAMYGKTGKDNPASRPVVMISLEGIVEKEFECLREVNDFFGKDRCFSYISKRCISKQGGAYGYMWLFTDDYHIMNNMNTFDEWVTKNSQQVKRVINANELREREPVYQLEIGSLRVLRKFNSIAEAKESTGIRTQSIIRNCKHGSNSAGGFSWIFEEEYNSIDKQELHDLYSYKYKKPPKKSFEKNKKSVICLNTNDTFDGIVDAIEYFNLCKGANINAVCRGARGSAGKHPITNEPLKWMYYEDYLKIHNKVA